jgi:hypothetical protein
LLLRRHDSCLGRHPFFCVHLLPFRKYFSNEWDVARRLTHKRSLL